MTPLLEQFLSESSEITQGIGEKLMQLEDAPNDQAVIKELFRLVHTLKGNSGLFTFPEMTRVLHAGEDLLGMVRSGQIAYSRKLADRLLEAMDFVGELCDEIESTECIDASHAADSQNMADALRSLMTSPNQDEIAAQASISRDASSTITRVPASPAQPPVSCPPPLGSIPEAARMAALRQCQQNDRLHWITYRPERECFFHGDDPLNCARRTPGLMWGCVLPSEPLPPLAELDTYRCLLDFHLLTAASREELAEYFRYIPDQVDISAVHPLWLVIPQGDLDGSPVEADFLVDATRLLEAGDTAALKQKAQTALDCSRDGSWFASVLRWLLCLLDTDENIDGMAQNSRALRLLIQSIATATPPDWTGSDSSGSISAKLSGCIAEAPPDANSPEVLPQDDQAAFNQILAAQRQILLLDDQPAWHTGRLKAVAAVLANLSQAVGNRSARSEIQSALDKSLSTGRNAPLLAWLDARNNRQPEPCLACLPGGNDHGEAGQVDGSAQASPASKNSPDKAPADEEIKFGRRGEDSLAVPKTLKVDQAKIDRLMNLIGELVVEKNALPYLAKKAESQFGIRELSREIKGHYSVINRIADEMQDAIMQVRMMAVSFIFQRFRRMVRDISRKLGKEVQLVLEGEETEADKNIIESLADPLIHIVRNSLDHGLETPEVRLAAGKPATGKLILRAAQETDRVIIEIIDDGKGIDPSVIKRKAYEKGIIDEATLKHIGDQEAINLIFAAGLSTAAVVSDLSGRGVGMDVVRSAVEKINGTVFVDSKLGQGTKIRISLPLSMAVTQVMVIESDRQLFGVPMDNVVETVRIPRSSIRTIKQSQIAVLRGRIVPLKSLNTLLGIAAIPQANSDDELAVLLVQAGNTELGLLVDSFQETIGVIQKPLNGVLSGLSAYSGSALMGDGSVLMILNIREIV